MRCGRAPPQWCLYIYQYYVDYVTILYEPVDRIVCDKLMLVQNLSAGVGQEVTTREIAEPIVDNKFHHRGGDLVVNLVRF